MGWVWLRDSSLVSGPLPVVFTVVGAVGMGMLLARSGTHWWCRWVPAGIAIGVVATATFNLVKPFPDLLPVRVMVWLVLAVFGVVLATGQLWSGPWWRRVVAVPALLLVIALAGVKINAVYQYRPTIAATLGLSAANEVPFAEVARPARVLNAPADLPLAQVWHAPAGLPAVGKVAQVVIAATVSGFRARPGWVYLPPAYLVDPRPRLPVLVLVAGQPGWPTDWLTAGHLGEVMDRFAAGHAGLAPVVVVPDATGSPLGDPLCLDSALGRAQTYLAVDVPAWVASNLQVNTDRRHWAIGGFSYGGTCSLQLAVNAPTVYPSFLDIAGDAEPSLGNRRRTLAATFAGDEAAFRAVNPLDVLARSQLPASAGRLVVGREDGAARAEALQVIVAAARAGMDVALRSLSGAHTWQAAVNGLSGQLGWLSWRQGLTAKPPATP